MGHYTYQLVRHLLKIDKENQYVLFFDRKIREHKMAKFLQPNSRVKFFPFIQYAKFLPLKYNNYLISAVLESEKLDIFHSPILSLPSSYKGNCVITAHGFARYRGLKYFPKEEFSKAKKIKPLAINQAKKIIAPSKFVQKELLELFDFKKSDISVIHHGLDERFLVRGSEAERKKILDKYKISKKYIFFLGTLEARKNIAGLIETFEFLREELKLDWQLVLAGHRGFGFKNIDNRIKKSKHKKNIILTGYVSGDDLDALFGEAEVYIFPSFYEGFGLSVIEAMAKGAPIITSNTTAFPEIAHNAALLVSPDNSKEMKEALKRILFDEDLKQNLKNKGIKRAKEFSWDKCAKQTLQVYKESL
ncbi:MAG: Group 1 glycosyl transferase [Parcubacteria group bacterium Athens0714_12]|nr:MAG: Group 1 glycosyl transferase [Parcubacteria group bacterium Athens0714_12]